MKAPKITADLFFLVNPEAIKFDFTNTIFFAEDSHENKWVQAAAIANGMGDRIRYINRQCVVMTGPQPWNGEKNHLESHSPISCCWMDCEDIAAFMRLDFHAEGKRRITIEEIISTQSSKVLQSNILHEVSKDLQSNQFGNNTSCPLQYYVKDFWRGRGNK